MLRTQTERDIVRLKYVEGVRSKADIARRLGVNRRTVSRAVKQFASDLHVAGIDPRQLARGELSAYVQRAIDRAEKLDSAA